MVLFTKDGNFSSRNIIKFASNQGVAPFIVVGRLQKDGLVAWSQFQNLKPKYVINF